MAQKIQLHFGKECQYANGTVPFRGTHALGPHAYSVCFREVFIPYKNCGLSFYTSEGNSDDSAPLLLECGVGPVWVGGSGGSIHHWNCVVCLGTLSRS